MILEGKVSHSVATLGENLLNLDARTKKYGKVGYNRVLLAVGLVGSAAPGDTIVEVLIGGTGVAVIGNSRAGADAWPGRDDIKACREVIPANTELELVVRDAPSTYPVAFHLTWM